MTDMMSVGNLHICARLYAPGTTALTLSVPPTSTNMSIFHRLRLAIARRQDLLDGQGVASLRNVTPLFEAKPRWTNKWTFPLVCTQLIVS